MAERKGNKRQRAFTQYSLWETPKPEQAVLILQPTEDIAAQQVNREQEAAARDAEHTRYLTALAKTPPEIAEHITYLALDAGNIEEARGSTVPTSFFIASTRDNGEQVYVPGIVIEREADPGRVQVMTYAQYVNTDPAIALDAIVQVFPKQIQHEPTPGHVYHPSRRPNYPQTDQGVHDWQQAGKGGDLVGGILSKKIFDNIDAARRRPLKARYH